MQLLQGIEIAQQPVAVASIFTGRGPHAIHEFNETSQNNYRYLRQLRFLQHLQLLQYGHPLRTRESIKNDATNKLMIISDFKRNYYPKTDQRNTIDPMDWVLDVLRFGAARIEGSLLTPRASE